MKYRLLLNNLGKILLIVCAFLLLPTIYAIIKNDGMIISFIITIGILLIMGIALVLIKAPKQSLSPMECLVIVALSWIIISLIGSLPFFLSGYIPNFIDALYESTSGFTTTGSTILNDIEILPKSLLLYRNFLHWIGGLGIIMFVLSIAPDISSNSYNIIKAEAQRANLSKLISKVSGTSRILCIIYVVLTAIIFITLLILGLDSFNSACLAFSTAGTGGFVPLNDSVAGYGNAGVEIAITIFMFISSINFAILYILILKQFKKAFRNEELIWYVVMVVVSILIITINILNTSNTFWQALLDASFHVVSYVTTTGFTTQNVNTWPILTQIILICLSFSGACAGSTAGGVKVYRICIATKSLFNKRKSLGNLHSYSPLKYNGEIISDDESQRVLRFIFSYITIIFGFAILVAIFDNINVYTTLSASLAQMSNVGIGLDRVEGFSNYDIFSYPSKMLFIVEMLLGRLEIIPLIALFNKNTWRRTI